MNESTAVVRKQIESCRELLRIFQGERQIYLARPTINLDDVTRILCRKKQLVDIFDQQHQLIRQLKEKNAGAPVDNENKELMSELGSILEQLLVIDHENEKLLRHCLTTRNPMAAAMTADSKPGENTSVRARPALQRQLPFVPGMRAPAPAPMTAARTASAATIPPAPRKEEPAPVTTENQNVQASVRTGGRHLIRNYVQTANLLNLSSKYA